MSAVRPDLSPLMLAAIGLVVYGVVRRWAGRRRRARSWRASQDERVVPAGPVASTAVAPGAVAVDGPPESSARRWWRDPVGAVPILVGLAMILGSAVVARAFGTVVSISAALFLPGR